MTVFSIWESRFAPEHVERGREVTDAIWQEMPDFPGYLRHVLIEDLDDPGHLFVVSEWESREAADKVLAEYASSPNARLANELVAEPRECVILRERRHDHHAEQPLPLKEVADVLEHARGRSVERSNH